jgi:hypothetical protein
VISDDRLQQALVFLSETDSSAAELKTDVERKHWIMKKVEAMMYIHSDGAVEMRKAQSKVSKEVEDATDAWLTALAESEKVVNKRKTEALITEIYRTESANRRSGGI